MPEIAGKLKAPTQVAVAVEAPTVEVPTPPSEDSTGFPENIEQIEKAC